MDAVFISVLLSLVGPDPVVEIERLVPADHPHLWCPLAVTIRSQAGFKGEAIARSSFGMDFAREVEVVAGGQRRVILPAIDPDEVVVGDLRFPVPRGTSASRIVAVDGRLSYAPTLVSTDEVAYRVFEEKDFRELLSKGLLEAFDLVLLSDAKDRMIRGVVAPTREDAQREVEKGGAAVPSIGVKDRDLWGLAPREGWVSTKKSHTLFFTAVYAFAGFLALALVGGRKARWVAAAVLGVPALFTMGYFMFFPRGQLLITEHSCEIVPAEGAAREWRVWFASSGPELVTDIRFPRLVKPVFYGAGTERPYTILDRDQGCEVRGIRIGALHAACFAGAEDRAPTMRVGTEFSRPLYRARMYKGNRCRSLGDVAAGAPLPPAVDRDDGPPPEPEFGALARRFAAGEWIYGRLDPGESTAAGVGSPDLADARRHPALFLQQVK